MEKNFSNELENKYEYVTLEQLSELFSENGYLCFGHGTGRRGNSDELVDEIFREGLRTKDNSLFFTAIGLSTPTEEIKASNRELGIPEPTIEGLKNQLNNWPHLESKKIIIARLPIEYINEIGDRSDLDGERFRAFYIPRTQQNGDVTYYLDSKFIVGCYDAEKNLFRLNEKYEKKLSQSSIDKLKEGYMIALQKTKDRLSKTILPITQMNSQNEIGQNNELNFDYDGNYDFPDIDEEFIESSSKRR